VTATRQIRNWTPEHLPDLAGKNYLITGGNSGIGLEAAIMLAAAGADIVIACRNPQKAERAREKIEAAGPGTCETVTLDLSSLASVEEAVADVRARWDGFDALVNNAGIMQTPETRTEDGFELQLATNHLGHFLFSGKLFDLVANRSGRIVSVSSIAHYLGRLRFGDLMFESRYDSSLAYGQSKLANLMFILELHQRLRRAGSAVSAVACHPGYSATELQSTGPTGLLNSTYKVLNAVFAQPAYNGAIPTVLAAAGEEAESGCYYGPRAFGGARGPVGNAHIASKALDEEAGERLWDVSEGLVGFKWSFTA